MGAVRMLGMAFHSVCNDSGSYPGCRSFTSRTFEDTGVRSWVWVSDVVLVVGEAHGRK